MVICVLRGETRTLLVPPGMGYGDRGVPNVRFALYLLLLLTIWFSGYPRRRDPSFHCWAPLNQRRTSPSYDQRVVMSLRGPHCSAHILAKICFVYSCYTWSSVNTSCTPGTWSGYYLAYWRISYLAHLFATIRGGQSLPEAYISSQLVSIYLRWEYILVWDLQSFSK